jgi:Flp pilus assembly protein TadG
MSIRQIDSRTTRRRQPRRRGTATVEFAIVAPVLIVLAMGLIEVTRAVQVKNTLTDAVRSGCRLAIQPGASNAVVVANINQVLTNAGIPTGDVTVTIQVNGTTADVSTAVQGNMVSVKIGLPVDDVAWVIPMFFTSKSVESETLVMMRQG